MSIVVEALNLDIIDNVNREVLKSFKNLQREKTNLYTSACNEYLTCINDKTMIVYDNPEEIDFEGTFRLTRNKLVPVTDQTLGTSPEKAIDLKNFNYLGSFGKNITDLQAFCYDRNVRVNMVTMTAPITQLISIYKKFKLYENTEKNEVMFVFNNNKHKTYLLSKLV